MKKGRSAKGRPPSRTAGKPTVFVSYSHKDEIWKDRLVTHLKVLQMEGMLNVWEDRQIGAGDDWYEEIKNAMNQASVAILLVSADFLTSKFILEEEVPRLLERREKEGVRVFPVILKPCAWKKVKWLARMQVRPTDGKPLSGGSEHEIDAGLTAIAEEVASIIGPTTGAKPGKTWTPLPPERIFTSKLPSTSPDLFGREQELALLDATWDDPNTNMVSLVAWGGVGKTALVNVWLTRMAQDNFRGAERVLGYSFYSQGAAEGKQASADVFIDHALGVWFQDPDPTKGSPWEKGERLADYVKKQRTLVILDGLEPLQHPPGEMEGRLKDPGLQCLLRDLALHNPGLCVLTTRLAVNDLKDFVGTSVNRVCLEDLSSDAGAKLLEHLGVKGTPEELRQACVDFGGHALALTLLGRYLADVYDGDIRKRDLVPKLTEEEQQGGHAKRVMEAYERWFESKPEQNILYIMGLFDRPAEAGAIEALRADPPIEGVTSALEKLPHQKWQLALKHLRNARLLAAQDQYNPGTLDCHPLVREHFGEKLQTSNPAAWKEAHSRLYEYYKSATKEFPDKIEEMAPLFAAVAHGCQAGRHQEALDDVYWRRIKRRDKFFNTKKLGVYGADLAALSGFFDSPWHKPVGTITKAARAFVLNAAGHYLHALGRLAEAEEPMLAGLQADIALKDWRNAAIRTCNLSELYLTMGDLAKALDYAEQSVDLAGQSGDAVQLMVNRAAFADALHQAGHCPKAADAFREAEELQEQGHPQYPLLYSLPGFKYCDLLLSQGKSDNVQRRARQTLEWAQQAQAGLLSSALDHLSLGQAHLLQAVKDRKKDLTEAARHLNHAVDGLRQAGGQEFIARGLLGRAELYGVTAQFDKARRDLDEAMTISARGGMKLHEARCRLEYARLHLATGDKQKARESLVKADDMISKMGYHRRDPEVQLAYAELLLAEGEKKKARTHLTRAKKLIKKMGCHRWDWEAEQLEARLK